MCAIGISALVIIWSFFVLFCAIAEMMNRDNRVII
jgi:hypothetical protein